MKASVTSRGSSADGASGAAGRVESFSPTSGELLGSVPATEPATVQSVVEDVAEVQPFWAQLRPSDRGRHLKRAAQVIIDNLSDLSALIAREQGKPRTEAYSMELLPTIDALHWLAGNAPDILADERIRYPQVFFAGKRSFLSHEPLGVVAVIAPWNYPWSIPFGEVAMALVAGNGVVLKPSSLTPLVGQRIQAVFERAGLPEGLVRTVHGSGTGQALVESSAAKVFFTGSVETGRAVAATCARQIKGCVLELGGKDPQLVMADAHLPHAVAGALWGGFANAGQTCSGIERAYVMRDVADRFVSGVVKGARALRLGDPLSWSTEVGPMVSVEQHDAVSELVDDAVAAGATLHCGGPTEVAGTAGAFYAPAVLTGVTHDMRIMREEVFGPVLPIMTVDSEEEAIALANDSDFGLGASVWTLDRDRGRRIASRIESGMVWINDHSYSHGAMQTPWGGEKQSGLGRSHSKLGLWECSRAKHVAWEPSRARAFWWHPYDDTIGRALHASAQLLYGRDDDKLAALRRGAEPLARLGGRVLRDAVRR